MARLVVVSHKECWRSAASPSGFATIGGFPFQMAALASLFDETRILVPIDEREAGAGRSGEIALSGERLAIVPLTRARGRDWRRKFRLPFWLVRNIGRLVVEVARADVVHTPIPGDIGTLGMVLALLLRKRLYVRHCGNWQEPRTAAERWWRRTMERRAGGRNVMLATGGGPTPPSASNPEVGWIFSTSLTRETLDNCRTTREREKLSAPRLIHVSRQVRDKGTALVIAALPALRRGYPAISLDVVGDGDELPALRRLTDHLGLGEIVRFHGQRSQRETLDLLAAADLLCLPSRSEGFPKAVLEAMACGLPVIARPVSVLPHLVGNDAGRLLKDGSTEAIVAAVDECLGDADNYIRMSHIARQRAGEFSLEEWARRIGERLAVAGFPLRTIEPGQTNDREAG